MTRCVKSLALAGVSALGLSCGAARAHTATPPPGEAANALAEVVVTAQKREQSINKVPLSVTALTGAQLAEQQVRTGADLARVVPGLTFTQSQFDAPTYTLRGVGFYESSLSANPAVSVYVDEVPLPYPAMTRGALLDLERVEVLKGPQGTLFGQNSTGGAINYVAAKPTADLHAGGEVSYGRFDTVNANGYVSGPIAPTLNGRLSLQVDESGPWQQSRTRSAELGDSDVFAGRLLLNWKPTDRLSVTLNLNGWRDASDTQAPQAVGIYPAVSTFPVNPVVLAEPLNPTDDRQADWDPGAAFTRDNGFWQGALRADWQVAPSLKLTSITAYERLDRSELTEGDGTPATALRIGLSGHISSVSQELRATGEAGSRLRYIVGVNYQHDDIFDQHTVDLTDGTNSKLFGLSFGPFNNVTANAVNTYAVFGNLNYKLTDQLTLEGGLRYTNSQNRFRGCTEDYGDGRLAAVIGVIQSFLPGPLVSPARAGQCVTIVDGAGDAGATRASLDEDNVSWRFGASWQADPTTLLYANVSRGYKAGDFPNLSASSGAQFAPVSQEKLQAYEAGIKKGLFGRTLQLNAAGFYYDYSDKQLRGRILDPVFGQLEALVNIPESYIAGAELQAVWSPSSHLQASAGVSYTHSEIQRFTGFNQFGGVRDFKGTAFPYTPEWTVTANADYRFDPVRGVTPFVGGGITFNSKANGGLGEDSRLAIDSYALLDLRAGVESPDKRWRAFLYGRNVTDAYYWINALNLNDTIVRYAGRPATWGFTLAYRY